MVGEAPLISVLLPAFDAARTLPSCLRSIQAQSEPRWQCVVVDDGSTDETRAVATGLARGDERIAVVGTDAGHRGLIPALQHGLAHCHAPYVARMDADDLMHRERLAAQLTALESSPLLAAVGCHVRIFPRAALTEGLRRYERWLGRIDSATRLAREAFVECPVVHPSLMIRTPILREQGYRDPGWAEDYDLILRLLAAGHRIGMVARPLLLWRDGPTRMWRTHPRYAQERFTAAKAWFLTQGLLASSRRYVLWGYGATGRTLRRALVEHERTPSHIVELHPGRLGQRIHGARVIPPGELPALRGTPIVVSVAGEGARAQIRAAMAAMGFQELEHYVCCA